MLRLALIASVLSSLLGCGSPLSPKDASGVYVLRSGTPSVLKNASVRIEILADTLWLDEDGSARRVARESFDFVAHRDTTLTREETYRYHVEGHRIELEFVCPPNALCSAPPHLWGTATGAALELRPAIDPRAVLSYRRIYL